MSKITVTLKEKYKSFDVGFSTVLEGDLIILSGVNGSGKSQFMDIINGKGEGIININRKRDLERIVLVDEESVNYRNIAFKSYKDNISIPEIIRSSSAVINQSFENAWQFYKTNNLQTNIHNGPQFKDSCDDIIKLLGPLYSLDSKDITEDQFKNILRENNFFWSADDYFQDIIGNLFYLHAIEIAYGQQNAGKVAGPAFDPLVLGIAPWTELNNLFEILKLDYRFRDEYEVKVAELTETPKIFQIDSYGQIIESESRNLKDLSDGEKTIISLCFISMQKKSTNNMKLLLLDEYDAVLNPSLIESFFIVLEKYFLSRGVTVILTTHSPATIALAPDYASYYEVFKKNFTDHRIIKIDREQYHDLQLVNKRFYDKIANQANRIKELEQTLQTIGEVTIITEGKTDWKYILKALEYFHSKGEFPEIHEEYFYRFGSKEDVENAVCGTKYFAELGEGALREHLSIEINSRITKSQLWKNKIIGVFDSDTDIKIKSKIEYGVFSFKIIPPGISTEFLFSEEVIKTYVNEERLFIGEEFDQRTGRHLNEKVTLGTSTGKRAGKKEIIDNDVYDERDNNKALSKEKFAQAVYNGEIKITGDDWERFRHIFEQISNFISTEMN